MHRSITLSQIDSSTFSNNDEETDVQSKKQKVVAKIGIGLAEFLVCSLYQCYGILLAQDVEIRGYTIEQSAWTTMTYLAAWHLTDPISKISIKHLEMKGYFHFKIMILMSTLLLATGVVIPPHYLCYGIFGGSFSNMIYSLFKRAARKGYKTTEKSFEANIQSARAISLLIMPHVVLLLISYFSADRVNMIYSAIVLNIVPAALIIRLPKEELRDFPISTNRYQTLPAFSQQMKEMSVFSTPITDTFDIHYCREDTSDFEAKSEDEEEDDDDLLVSEKVINHSADKNVETPQFPAPLTPHSIQMYFSQAGVSILPEIPEEEEEEDINVINAKRLSRISTQLEELNSREREKRESLRELVITKEILAQPDRIQNIEYISNYTEKKTNFISDMKISKKNLTCTCSPYTLFVWKRRMRSIKDFLIDFLFIPISASLSNLHFYPTLFSKVSISVSSILFISLSPYMSLKKNDGYKKEDMAFLLSYIAFSWCMSLILLPLLLRFSAIKMRIAFIVGLVMSGCSMLLLTKRKMTNDFITWSALLFGFGYGLSRFAETLVYRAFAGKRKYGQFEGALNVSTGLFVILIYYLVYINNVDLVGWFPIISSICYFLNGGVWVIAPFVKEVLIFLWQYFRQRSDSASIL